MNTKAIEKIKENLGFKQTWIKGEYWADHSGEIEVTYKNRSIFHADELKAKDHLKWLKMTIETTRQELVTLEKAYEVLEDTLYHMPKPVKDA